MVLEEDNSKGRLQGLLFGTVSVQNPCDVAITDYKYSNPSIHNYQNRLNFYKAS